MAHSINPTPAPGHDRPVRTAVIAGTPAILDAVELLLGRDPAISIAGTAANPAQAVELVQRAEPDVALIANFGSAFDELDAVGRLSALDRRTRLLVFAREENRHAALRMLRAGAHGIVPLTVSSAGMIEAIRTAHATGSYLSPELRQACAERYLDFGADRGPEERLTEREYQIMRLLALANTKDEIAGQLGVDVKTVYTHRSNILRKLELRNDADITRFAIRHGFVPA